MHEFLGKLTKEDLLFLAPCIGVVGVIIGTLLSGVFALLTDWLKRSHEIRKQVKDLGVQLAIEEYRREQAFQKDNNGKILDPGNIQNKVVTMTQFVKSLDDKK